MKRTKAEFNGLVSSGITTVWQGRSRALGATLRGGHKSGVSIENNVGSTVSLTERRISRVVAHVLFPLACASHRIASHLARIADTQHCLLNICVTLRGAIYGLALGAINPSYATSRIGEGVDAEV